MNIVIDSWSAAEFWRNAGCQGNTDLYSIHERAPADFSKNTELTMSPELAKILPYELNLPVPLHIMVSSPERRYRGDGIVCSVMPQDLPKNSFVEIISPGIPFSDRVFVVRPELCFIQLANHLSFNELVYMGFELCGTFMNDSRTEAGFVHREPIATLKSMEDYILPMKNTHGIYPARQAVKHLVEGANSPMEAKLIMTATLPYSRGGYGIPKPELNKSLSLSPEGMSVLRQRQIIADAVWEGQKLVMEYDSNLAHLTSTQHARDKNRISAMTFSGYKVVPVTYEDVSNFRGYEKTFRAFRKSLGLRTDENALKKYEYKRYDLISFLRSK